MIELRDLQFTWPGDSEPTLQIDQWSVRSGELVFVQGPSGVGKSTLLSLLAGVQSSYRGSVKVMGQEWRELKASQRDQFRAAHIGLIFQQFNLIPYLNCIDNVCLPLNFARKPNTVSDACESARSLLVSLGIHTSSHLKAARLLSVGQQQRVAAARAMINRPEVILADEPTSALDHANQMQFIEQLIAHAKKQNTAIVFVSHDDRLEKHFSRSVQLNELNRALAAHPKPQQ